MKKLLVIAMCIILCACGKTVTWDDVSEKFKQVEEGAGNPAENAEVFLAADYKKIISDLKTGIDSLEKADEDTLLKIYANATVLEKAASEYNNDQAAQLKAMAAKAKELARSNYDKNADQTKLKEELDQQIDTVLSWSQDEWAAIEKRKLISWADVESEYETLKEEALDGMTARKEVAEYELEELNDTIVSNYKLIADGITDANREKADELYKAAVVLYEYTRSLKTDNCRKVAEFADDAMNYVLKQYGAQIEDEDYDFDKRVESASKWSLNLWNEVTTQLKR